MWLELSGSLYLFGTGGVDRVSPITPYDKSQFKHVNTVLYRDGKIIDRVEETYEQVLEKLNVINKTVDKEVNV